MQSKKPKIIKSEIIKRPSKEPSTTSSRNQTPLNLIANSNQKENNASSTSMRKNFESFPKRNLQNSFDRINKNEDLLKSSSSATSSSREKMPVPPPHRLQRLEALGRKSKYNIGEQHVLQEKSHDDDGKITLFN